MKVALIPARGGSQRIPHKNRKLFLGLPIILYAIRAAKKSKLFDRIIVSTDDVETAAICAQEGNVWPIYRPASLAGDEVGTQAVAQHAAGLMPSDYMCVIYATTPLMQAIDIERGYRVLREHEHFNFAMSVGTEPLQDAGQFYFGRTWAFRAGKDLIAAHTAMIPIQSRYVCDINTIEDFERAEIMYKANEEQPG